MKDVVSRGEVRDSILMEKLLVYLANNSSSPFSSHKIANYLTSIGRKTSPVTIENYISLLEKAFDLLSVRSGFDYGNDLEGLVYFELARRARKVRVGKVGNLEVDFIAEDMDGKSGRAYYQVCASIMDSGVLERALAPLKAIRDDYPKHIVTTDRFPINDFQGIQHVNIIDFLSGR